MMLGLSNLLIKNSSSLIINTSTSRIHTSSNPFFFLKPKTILSKKVTDEFIPIPPSVAIYNNLDGPKGREIINLIRSIYNKKGIVYGIVNNLNNKVYIGSTIDSKNRFYTHFIRPLRSNKHLQSAINLIGLVNFTLHVFTVVELSESLSKKDKKDMILSLEQKYIDIFPKSQLYNFLFLSSSPLGFKHSEETKLLMSINSKGKNRGQIPLNKGKLLSDLAKLNMKMKTLHRFKPVYFYDDMNNLVTIYESFNEARRKEKCRANNLLLCIKEGLLFKGFKVSYQGPNSKN